MKQAAEKKIPKARWLYLLPVFFLVNFFGFMDRQVISIALPGGMMEELGLGATVAGLAAGIFAAGALFLQVQAGHMAQKGRVKTFVTVCIIAWSVLALMTAFVQSGWQLLTVRFFLGVFEGALAPAVLTLITYWFPDKNGERNKANSFFFTSVSVAAVLTGPIGGTIIEFYDWRILYLILGVASFLTAILWIAFVVERPENAKWISDEERDYIVTTINEERELVKKANNIKLTSNKLPLKHLFNNKYVWLMCTIGFCVNIGQFGFSMWMPTMIQSITKAGISGVGWISAIPSLVAIVGLWTWSYITQKTKDRRLTTGTPLLLFGLSLIIGTFVVSSPIMGIAMMCVTGFFLQAHMPSFTTLPSLLFIQEVDGPARGLIGVSQGLGAFLGPYIVGLLISILGSTNAGMYVLATFLAIGFLISFLLPKNVGVRESIAIDKKDAITISATK